MARGYIVIPPWSYVRHPLFVFTKLLIALDLYTEQRELLAPHCDS